MSAPESSATQTPQPSVEDALSKLSIDVEDKYSVGLAAAAPSDRDVQVRALEALKEKIDAIGKDITVKVAGLKQLRNQAEAPINRLPVELFIDILALSIDWPNWSIENTHTLAQVSKYWFNVVVGSPRFWPEIDVAQKLEIRKMVLKKNASGPIIVRCTSKPDETQERTEFLKDASQYCDRWRGLIFKGRLTDDIFTYLESPAPLLRELFLYQYSSNDATQKLVRISDGVPMRHVDLDFIYVPWDSARLRGLESLQIRNLRGDLFTLPQLHEILSSSTRLRWLLLAKLSDGDTPATENLDSTKNAQVEVPEGSVTLPALTTLVLEDIPKRISQYLLSHITTSSVSCIKVDDVDPFAFMDSTSAFHDLIRSPVAGAQSLDLRYDEQTGIMRILACPGPEVGNEWIHWVKQTPGVDFSMKVQSTPDVWRNIAPFMQLMSSTAALHITLLGRPEPTGEENPHYPLVMDVLREVDVVTYLKFANNYPAGAVLRYLSEKRPDASGTMGWPSARLNHIHLHQPWRAEADDMIEDVVTFATRRHSPEESGSGTPSSSNTKAEKMEEPKTPVKKLGILTAPETIIERLKAEESLTGVEIRSV